MKKKSFWSIKSCNFAATIICINQKFMKKIVLLTAFVSCTTVLTAQNLQGQFSIKPMAGINVTRVSGGVIDDFYHNKVRFTAGLEAEYGIKPWLGILLGAIYSQQGAKVDAAITSFFEDERGFHHSSAIVTIGKVHSEYINFPLMANFYIPQVKGLAVKIGLQLGLLTSSKMEGDVEMMEVVTVPYSGIVKDIPLPTYQSFRTVQTDVCKSIDFGIPVGLSYEYKNVVLDARYYFGLTKIDNTPEPEDVRNRHFSFTLGYRFRL